VLISHILSENLKSSGWSSFQIAIHICLDSAFLCDSQTCGITPTYQRNQKLIKTCDTIYSGSCDEDKLETSGISHDFETW
jgi:hypothetical protein